MRRIKDLTLILALLSLTVITRSQIVNITDAKFKAALVNNASINLNLDGEIQVSEAQSYNGTINVDSSGIYDLTGIESFNNLTALHCKMNYLTNLNIKNNTALTYLDCSGYTNNIKNLDVSNNTALIYLNCSNNLLDTLDVRNNTALIHLNCYDNLISGLDISNNSRLTYLNCGLNKITMLDLNSNSGLQTLLCSENKLSGLILSNNSELTEVDFHLNKINAIDFNHNPLLTRINCTDNKLTTLNVSVCPELTSLHCALNNISVLDVTLNAKLVELYCSSNEFYTVDLTNNKNLSTLYCIGCGITHLDISNNTKLKTLYCHINALTHLDVSNNKELEIFHCWSNQLDSIDLSQNNKLQEVDLTSNHLVNLDVSNIKSLKKLRCVDNKLSKINIGNCTSLEDLDCHINNLEGLDVSTCTKLSYLDCGDNKLINLDLQINSLLDFLACERNKLTTLNIRNGNNKLLTDYYFRTNGNPNLLCIEVDEAEFSKTNWYHNIDEQTVFKEDCSCRKLDIKGRGRVQIKNGTLVTDRGTLLRGVYVSLDNPWSTIPTRKQVTEIKNLGLNTIHVYAENPYDESQENPQPGYKMNEVDSLVKWTAEDSLYLILTMAGWNPAKDSFLYGFWRLYADRYKDKTHLIFEIVNEPYFAPNWPPTPYDSITIEMERSSYDTIRKYAPHTHVQFMSYAYTNTNYDIIQEIKSLGGEIDWKNASIAAHGYVFSPEKHREFIKMVQNAGYAITITEIPVIRYKDNANDLYANLAFIRVLEEESVSYINFISVKDVLLKPYLFKSKIESSEIRWNPDFGTWPADLTAINYINPYKPLLAGFCDAGSGIHYYENLTLWYISSGAHIAFNNLDFGNGADSVLMRCSSEYENSIIEIHLDSANGTLAANCSIPNAGRDNVKLYSYPVANFEGVHNIYLVFKGSTSIFKSIVFTNPGINANQLPYNGIAFELPGKVEAEDYDNGAQNTSYFDSDLTNAGMIYRFDDVDIDSTGDGGYCIGWTGSDEWLEYTVSCKKENAMDIQFRVACTAPGDKIKIKLNNRTLATVNLPNTGGYYTYQTVTVENITIPAGEDKVLRLELLDGSFNLDWMNFVARPLTGIDEVINNKSFTFCPNPAHDYVKIKSNEPVQVEIYSLQGQLLIKKKTATDDDQIPLGNLSSGSYIIKFTNGIEIYSEKLIIE